MYDKSKQESYPKKYSRGTERTYRENTDVKEKMMTTNK